MPAFPTDVRVPAWPGVSESPRNAQPKARGRRPRKGWRFPVLVITCLLACLPVAASADEEVGRIDPPLELVRAYPHLEFDDNATALAIAPDSPPRAVVAFQRGQVRVLPEDRLGAEAPLFLDLRETMREETDFEEGLHGLAFHPKFATQRRVYVCYSQRGPRRTVLSEFIVPEGEEFRADRRSERVLLEYPHPLGFHWSGCLAFGPDGFLYVSLGDGGLRDDPYRLAQNLWSLHAKILRLDVDGRSAGLAYRIPPDNPFAGQQEVRGEIWATGLRNVWGLAFDVPTGTLWCGDVGQDLWEEVNVIQRGGNYGWSEREGAARFVTRAKAPEEGGPFIDPIYSYLHTRGISIVGGYVYRANRLGRLRGKYLFGDWGRGKVWALSWKLDAPTATDVVMLHERIGEEPRFNPTVIGPDAAGEPLIFSHSPSVIYTLAEPPGFVEADSPTDPAGDATTPDPVPPLEPGTDDALENEAS